MKKKTKKNGEVFVCVELSKKVLSTILALDLVFLKKVLDESLPPATKETVFYEEESERRKNQLRIIYSTRLEIMGLYAIDRGVKKRDLQSDAAGEKGKNHKRRVNTDKNVQK